MIRIFAIAVLVIAIGTSCYHLVDSSKGLSNVYVDKVLNTTAEPQLGSMLRGSVMELLPRSARQRAEMRSLDLKITDINNSSLARAEIRDKASRDGDSDAYQTVLYRVAITVQYKLEGPDGKSLTGSVTGTGDLPKMHDRNVPLQHALKLAANDAAKKIIDAIVDASQL